MDDLTALFGLSQVDYDKIKRVLHQQENIDKVIIYGSRAKGTYKAGSDIDLTILGNCSWQELNQLESKLDDIMLPYKFDLSLYNHIDNKQLLEHISRVGNVFYSHQR